MQLGCCLAQSEEINIELDGCLWRYLIFWASNQKQFCAETYLILMTRPGNHSDVFFSLDLEKSWIINHFAKSTDPPFRKIHGTKKQNTFYTIWRLLALAFLESFSLSKNPLSGTSQNKCEAACFCADALQLQGDGFTIQCVSCCETWWFWGMTRMMRAKLPLPVRHWRSAKVHHNETAHYFYERERLHVIQGV